MNEDTDEQMVVRALIGVYNANGSVRGEVAYVLGKLTGRAHCALCDITHGRGRRPSFNRCVAMLPVEFEMVHLDERSPEVVTASNGCSPCVLVRTDAGPLCLLGPDDLTACDGDPVKLVGAIRKAVAVCSLRWP